VGEDTGPGTAAPDGVPGPGILAERIRAEPELRRVVQAAVRVGVSPSRFLGRPQVHLDGHGRVIPVPEWTDEDRALVLAFLAWESELCPGCRQPLSDTTRPEAENLYLPEKPTRCHYCTAISQAASIHRTDYHPSAVLYGVRVAAPAEDPDPT
jgi:hypothetical protein